MAAIEKPTIERASEDFLLTGDEFRASLRDGRRVVAANGETVEDVTTHPALAGGIGVIAGIYDAQFDPATRDLTTYVDEETGKRAGLAWKVPQTVDDLRQRRELIKFTTYETLGVFGRPPDYCPFNHLGLLTIIDKLEEQNPAWAENARNFVRWGRENNVLSADVVADVQSDRNIPLAQKPGRLRCVEQRDGGLVLYGAKPCASVAAQAHLGTVRTVLTPGADPEATLFCTVPVDTEGLTIVLREAVAENGDPEDHPLSAYGEEADGLLIFDHVYIPPEHVFSFRRQEMLGLYHELGALALWHVLARLSYRAEIFAGTAQVIADVLGTTSIPQVRDSVSEITAYAATLRAFTIAAEEEAVLKNGVLVPNGKYVTPGRLHSIVHYPRVMQLLRDMSGQGLISRFTKAQFDHDEIGAKLEEFMPGTGVSARGKNRLFNFVWDLTSSSHAMRVALFENVNATPPAAMRHHIYESHDRSEWAGFVRRFAGVDDA
jgi:4-hydroxyphenylacetate 3-monooxygenase